MNRRTILSAALVAIALTALGLVGVHPGLISTALVGVGALLSLLFILRYGRVDFADSPAGRHVMGLTGCIFLFLGLSFFVRLAGDYPGKDWVGVGLYAVLVALLANQHRLFTVQQRDEPAPPKEN